MPAGPRAASSSLLERNLLLIVWYQPIARTLFFGPIFFLFLIERFPVDRVLLLSAIYYVSVVVLEVPSGYFSDRISRVATLRISSLAMMLSYALFATGSGRFEVYVCGEMLLALGYAFRSGTDVSFHFDTLQALGRDVEFAPREARIGRNSYLAVSASALVGGLLGTLDLRLPYALGAVFMLVSLAIALRMREPSRDDAGYAQDGFFQQVRGSLAYATEPFLAWIFVYMTLMTTLEHIPWQFAQPYVAAAFGESLLAPERTPIWTGLLHASFAFVAAFAAGRSLWLRDRLGIGGTLLAVTALQTGLIVALAFAVHPTIALLLVLRSIQPAVSNVVVHAAVAPRVPQARRATYLSLHSFSGRLGYAGLLYGLSMLGQAPVGASGGELQLHASIEQMLFVCAVLSLAALGLLSLTSGALRAGAQEDPGPPPPRGSAVS